MKQSRSQSGALGRIARFATHVSLVVIVVASFLGYLADAWWGFELFTHFPLQYSIVLAGLCVVYGVMRRLRLFVCVLCVLGLNLVQILPLYFAEEVASEGEELEIVVFNLLRPNRQFDDVRDYLVESNADVILLLEVDHDWVRELDLEHFDYEMVAAEPRTDTSGIVLYARPGLCDDAEIVTFGPEDEWLPPIVHCTLEWGGREAAFIGMHPSPPKTEHGAGIRNFQLEEAAEWVAKQDHPVILAGDLNTTPFSPAFRELMARGNLLNSQHGYGYQWSWPVEYPFLAIPIDHCLHSPLIATTDRYFGPGLGSDHRPLHVSLRHVKRD